MQKNQEYKHFYNQLIFFLVAHVGVVFCTIFLGSLLAPLGGFFYPPLGACRLGISIFLYVYCCEKAISREYFEAFDTLRMLIIGSFSFAIYTAIGIDDWRFYAVSSFVLFLFYFRLIATKY